jgi:general secretion pathway protein A
VSGTGPLQSRDGFVYESFYGLSQSPFTLTPDPRFLYLSESHDEAIRRILQALRRRERFIVLSGDIGTGKTTLCRALIARLDPATFSSLVLNPFLSVDDLLRQLLVDFGIVSAEGARSDRFASAARSELTRTLVAFLETLDAVDGRAVLILDEAQHLSPRVLEELRVVSGLERENGTPLQVVLVGQPNLLEVLAAADLRQLDQRISLKAMLQPLGRDDVEPYISHRLTVAGDSVSVLFEPAAIKRVHAVSGGVPRVINLLCDRALMAGAQAGVHEITPEIVDRAADDVMVRRTDRRASAMPARRSRRVLVAAAAVVAALVTIGAAAILAPWHQLVTAPPPPLPDAPAVALPAIRAPDVPQDIRPTPPPTDETREVPDDFVAPPQGQ